MFFSGGFYQVFFDFPRIFRDVPSSMLEKGITSSVEPHSSFKYSHATGVNFAVH